MRLRFVLWIFVITIFFSLISWTGNSPWGPFEIVGPAWAVDGSSQEEAKKLIDAFSKALESGDTFKIQEAAQKIRSSSHAVALIENTPFLKQQLDTVLPLNIAGNTAKKAPAIEPASPPKADKLPGADALEALPPGAPKGENVFTYDEAFGTGEGTSSQIESTPASADTDAAARNAAVTAQGEPLPEPPPKPKDIPVSTQTWNELSDNINRRVIDHYKSRKTLTEAEMAELAKRNVPQKTYKPYATGDKPRVDAESSWTDINRAANYDAEVVISDSAKFSKSPRTSKLVDPKNAYIQPDAALRKSFDAQLKQDAFDLQQGVATGEQVRNLRQNNDAVNRMATRGEIENITYQRVQGDFAEFNEATARASARDAGLEFNPQKRIIKNPDDIFKPATDSDYILSGTDGKPATADQIAEARTNYNRRMNKSLKTKNVDYARKLDTDLMLNPAGATPEEFGRVADMSTDAYRRPAAAEAEVKLRNREPLTLEQSRNYTDEMLEMGGKKQGQIDQYRKRAIEARKVDPDAKMSATRDINAVMQQKMQLQAKYTNRLNDASNHLADQFGVQRPDVSDLSAKGAERSIQPRDGLAEPGVSRKNLIRSSISNANQDYLTKDAMRGYAEVSAGASTRASTPEFQQRLLDNAVEFGTRLSPADQGRLIDDVRLKYGDETAQALTKQMRIRNTAPDSPGSGGKGSAAPDSPGGSSTGLKDTAVKTMGDAMVALDILNTGQDFIDWFEGKKSGGEVVVDTIDRFGSGIISTPRMLNQRGGNLKDSIDKNLYANEKVYEAWVNQAGVALGDNVTRDERRQIIEQLNAGNRAPLDQKVAELNSKGVNITLPDESKVRGEIFGNTSDFYDFNSPSEQLNRVKEVAVGMYSQAERAKDFLNQTYKNLDEIDKGLKDPDVVAELILQQKENLSWDNLSSAGETREQIKNANQIIKTQRRAQAMQIDDLYETLIIKGASQQEAVEALIAAYGDGKKNQGGNFSKLRNLRERSNTKYDTKTAPEREITEAEDEAAWDKLRGSVDWQWGKERVREDEADENPFADGQSDQYLSLMRNRGNRRSTSRISRVNTDQRAAASSETSDYGQAGMDKELDAIYETTSRSTACWRDSDCPSSYRCRNSRCVPSGCEKNSDCPPGYACRYGECAALQPDTMPTGCTKNSDCPQGYACRDGGCVQLRPVDVPTSGCAKNADCPQGYACRDGRCTELWPDKLPGRCGKNSDCPEGYACREGGCVQLRPDKVPGSCGKNSDCPEGYACRDGGCAELRPDKVPGSCEKNSDCPEGYACRDGLCVKLKPDNIPTSGCTKNADCPQGFACRSGKCVKVQPDPVLPINYYYVLKESGKYYQRYSSCSSTRYRLVGPMTESQFASELSKRQADARRKVNAWQSYPRYGESGPYSIAVTLEGKSETIPIVPTGSATCRDCPPGEHIGLDPGKRYCHP